MGLKKKSTGGNMENKVYFIGLKCTTSELAEKVSLINAVPDEYELAYMGFGIMYVLLNMMVIPILILLKKIFSIIVYIIFVWALRVLFIIVMITIYDLPKALLVNLSPHMQ